MSKQFENKEQVISEQQLEDIAGGERLVLVEVGCELSPERRFMTEEQAKALGLTPIIAS